MKKSQLLLSLAAVAALAVALSVFTPYREPRYQGKTFTKWFEEELTGSPGMIYSIGPNGIVIGGPRNDSRIEAFRQMGAAAVPAALRFLGAKDTWSRRAYMSLYSRLPASVSSRLPKVHPAAETRAAAAYVLAAIGPEARDAVPDLMACLIDPDPGIRRLAIVALASIGAQARDAAPALKLLSNDADHVIRFHATLALTRIDPGAPAGAQAARPPETILQLK